MKSTITHALLALTLILPILAKAKTNFTPLPTNPIFGYWENWGESIKLTDIPKEYNIIAIAFMLTETNNLYIPTFKLDASCYLYHGGGKEEQFKADIKTVQSLQRPVIISLGGATGTTIIDTQKKEDDFVSGVIAIIDEYGFDGLDIDLEGESMDFHDSANQGSFAFNDLSTQLQHTISAVKRIHDHYGSDFILTAAPELTYVQYGGVGGGYYNGYTRKEGSFLPILENLREEFDLLNVQYYNYGDKTWIPYPGYDEGFSVGSIDALAQLLDLLLYGFNIPNKPKLHFKGFPAEKVCIGLPAVPLASGQPIPEDHDRYYMHTNEVVQVLNYITIGLRDSSFAYTMKENKIYPKFKGMMTWSINRDKTLDGGTSEYEFCKSYTKYFEKLNTNDSNGNGIPDLWTLTYFGTPDTDASSICSNGINTMLEAYITGIDPTNKTSWFAIEQCQQSAYNIIKWNSFQGRTYSIYATTNLLNDFDITIATNINWIFSTYTNKVNSENNTIFYKITAQIQNKM